MKELGDLAKQLFKHDHEEDEISGKKVLLPNKESNGYTTKSKDYTVIMHFSKLIRNKIMEHGLTDDGIEQAIQAF
jgi:hypothetical protein